MFSVAFCDRNDKDTLTQTVSGDHVENDRTEDNGEQTDGKVFKWKCVIACVGARTIKRDQKIREDGSGNIQENGSTQAVFKCEEQKGETGEDKTKGIDDMGNCHNVVPLSA